MATATPSAAQIKLQKLHKQLRDTLTYHPTTGEFRAKTDTTRRVARERVGTVRKDGSYIVSFNGELHTAGRLAYFWVTGSWPVGPVTLKRKTGAISDYKWNNIIASGRNRRNA